MFCFKNIPCTVFLYMSNSRPVFQGRLELQTGVEFLVACVHMDLVHIYFLFDHQEVAKKSSIYCAGTLS